MAHLGLLSLALLASGLAEAAPGLKQSDRVVVSTDDLNLSTKAGIATARARVRRATDRVCGDYHRVGVLPPSGIVRCRTNAARDADARIAALASRASSDRVAMAGAGKHD
jgi:UrcA family protein